MGSLAQLFQRIAKAMEPAVRQQIYDSGEGPVKETMRAITDGIVGIESVDEMYLDISDSSYDSTDQPSWNLTRDAVAAVAAAANREANR